MYGSVGSTAITVNMILDPYLHSGRQVRWSLLLAAMQPYVWLLILLLLEPVPWEFP